MNTINLLQIEGEQDTALLREDYREQRRVTALPLLKNEGLITLLHLKPHRSVRVRMLKGICLRS